MDKVYDLTSGLYVVVNGGRIKEGVFSRIQNELKPAFEQTMNILASEIEDKGEALTLMVSIYNKDLDINDLSGKALYMQQSLLKANHITKEIEYVKRFSDNIHKDVIYKITFDDAKRFGL